MLLNTIQRQSVFYKSTHISLRNFNNIRTLIKKSNVKDFRPTWQLANCFSGHRNTTVPFTLAKSHSFNADIVIKNEIKERKENISASGKENGEYIRDKAGAASESEAWEDTFGNLTDNPKQEPLYHSTQVQNKADELHEDSDDENEEDPKPLRVYYRKLPPGWYTKQMEKFAKEGKIDRAIDVLQVIMLKNDRIRPLPTHYYTLISLISKTGDTRKAFGFYKKMRDFGYEPIPQVFTALFNACSKSIYGKEDGFRRATKLIYTMKAKNITPSQITFNAMIKTFGCLGQTEIALHLADQSIKLYKPDDKTFANILMAAAGDEKAGFSLAIGVWRIASLCQIKPTLYHYMLLLRVVRCCEIGDISTFYRVLLQTSPFAMQKQLCETLNKYLEMNKVSQETVCLPSDTYIQQLNCPSQNIPNNEISDQNQSRSNQTQSELYLTDAASSPQQDMSGSSTETNQLTVHPPTANSSKVRNNEFPDVLKPGEILLRVLNMHAVQNKYVRLDMLGGVSGFLARMKRDGLTPNLAVFGQLFDIVDTLQEEDYLFSMMEELGISPDIDIISHAMLKRLRRMQPEQAKKLVQLMEEKGVQPNIFIFKYLNYILCKDGDTMRQFLDDLLANELPLTVHLMDGLMRNTHLTLQDKKYILQLMEQQDIHPTCYFLETLHKILRVTRERIIVQKEKDMHVSDEEKMFSDFNKFIEEWLKRVPLKK